MAKVDSFRALKLSELCPELTFCSSFIIEANKSLLVCYRYAVTV
jgi:hypothetical protein